MTGYVEFEYDKDFDVEVDVSIDVNGYLDLDVDISEDVCFDPYVDGNNAVLVGSAQAQGYDTLTSVTFEVIADDFNDISSVTVSAFAYADN